MFEGREAEIEGLLANNAEFRHLYNRHQELHRTVHEAEHGKRAMTETEMAQLKKEKLAAKDRMSELLGEPA